MIVPQGQPGGALLAVGAEVGPDSLPQRLQRLDAGAAAGHVNAHTLRRKVVHGDEDGGGALHGPTGRRVSAPHGIGAVGDDRAVMGLGPCGWPTRVGASSPASRSKRSTRPLLVRMPAPRSRAHTLR